MTRSLLSRRHLLRTTAAVTLTTPADFAEPLDRVVAMCKGKALVGRAEQYKDGR